MELVGSGNGGTLRPEALSDAPPSDAGPRLMMDSRCDEPVAIGTRSTAIDAIVSQLLQGRLRRPATGEKESIAVRAAAGSRSGLMDICGHVARLQRAMSLLMER